MRCSMSDLEHNSVTLAQQCLVLTGGAPDSSGARAVSQVYRYLLRLGNGMNSVGPEPRAPDILVGDVLRYGAYADRPYTFAASRACAQTAPTKLARRPIHRWAAEPSGHGALRH